MGRGLVALLGCCLLSAAVHANEDIAGSRDPAGVPRYPRAWIVDYSMEPDVEPREFVVSRVDRIRRDLHVEGLLRPDATVETATYQIPASTPLTDVLAHYREAFGGEVLFTCSGRDCGRSNDWANQIFRRAILYGPDGNQHYYAVMRDSLLLSVYIIERGNRRIYAHVQALTPLPAEAGSSADRLRRAGWLPVAGLVPGDDGALPEGADAALRALVPALPDAGSGPIYVVCHLYGPAQPDALLQASSRCADETAQRLSALLAGSGRDAAEVRGFGAGPLLPRSAEPANRIEVVLPGAGAGQSR